MIRVLIVDDHPVVRSGLAAVLSSLEGFDVVGLAADGREAVREAVIRRPDVVLMDLQMPGVDGFELTRRLKAAADTRDIIIVAVTAYAMKGDEERARAAGCDGYLAKPIDTSALPAQVERWLANGLP